MNLECNYCQRAFPNEESLELHKTAVSNLKINQSSFVRSNQIFYHGREIKFLWFKRKLTDKEMTL